MKKTIKNRKVAVSISIVLALVIAVCSTFAWISSQHSVVNRFENEGYMRDGSVIVAENFEEPYDWRPEEPVSKEVYAVNIGTGDVLVRLTFDEYLRTVDAENVIGFKHTELPADYSEYLPANVDISAFNGANWTEVVIECNFGVVVGLNDENIIAFRNNNATDLIVACYEYKSLLHDGETRYQSVTFGELIPVNDTSYTADEPPVFNFFQIEEEVVASWSLGEFAEFGVSGTIENDEHVSADEYDHAYLSELIELIYSDEAVTVDANEISSGDYDWFYNELDGFFYYLKLLGSGESTSMLLDSVLLSGNAGNEFTMAKFCLGITAQAIQATEEAVTSDSGWSLGSAAAAPQILIDHLVELCAQP